MNTKILILAASAAFLLPSSVMAQDAAPNTGWTGSGELGAFQSTGNTSSVGATAGLALTKESNKWRYKLRAIGDYQRTNGLTSREQVAAAIEPNYKINDRLYVYGLGQYERDKFQGFTSRYTVSGGAGYKVINTDAIQLDVKAGPAWRKTKFVGVPVSDSSLAGLAEGNLNLKVSPIISVTQLVSTYVQSGNSSLLSLTGVNAKIGKNITARLSYQIDHETKPPVGLKKTDTLLRTTLIFGF
jgi:putative salt-induced outer membrane protein